MTDTIEIYTDGAASGNPGPGGLGVVMKFGEHRKEISMGFTHTTNNRMELLAAIVGMEKISAKTEKSRIYSDSKYVVDSVNKGWVFNWAKKYDFAGKANRDLWERFLKVYDAARHEFVWVKGHADNPENNRCDVLAVNASKGADKQVDEAYMRMKGLIKN